MLQSNDFKVLCKKNKIIKWYDNAKLKENQYKAKAHIRSRTFQED